MTIATCGLHAWLLLAAWTAAGYIPVWQSDATLWTHAAAVAPLKPRPAVNVARALILQGELGRAEQWLTHTLALAELPHVPAYDRADAIAAAQGNLQTIAIMQAVLQP